MANKTDEAWLAISAKANEIVAKAIYDLQTDDQGYGESQFLRGRIQAAKEILEVLKPKLVASSKIERLRPANAVGKTRPKP